MRIRYHYCNITALTGQFFIISSSLVNYQVAVASTNILQKGQQTMMQTTIEAAIAEAKEAKARRARGETGLTSSVQMKQKILELAQSLSPADRQWLLERLQQFAQDNQLPENLTLEEAIHFYQTNQCSLGKAAEYAGRR